MTDYAALKAAGKRYNTDPYNHRPEDERADTQSLADQMAAELDDAPITPELLVADGMRCGLGTYYNGLVTVEATELPDQWRCWQQGQFLQIKTMGQLRALSRLAAQKDKQ